MTFRLRVLRYPRFNPNPSKPTPIRWPNIFRFADIVLWLTAALALIMLTKDGINIFYLLALSLIGLPLAVLMYVAVPLSAFFVPGRIIFGVLKHRFSTRMSLAIAVPFAALFANAADTALKSGPNGRVAAEEIVADQQALLPVTVPAHGIIGFRYDGPRWQWTNCPELCQTLLNEGRANLVMNFGRDGTAFQGFYRADAAGACAEGDRHIRRSDTICEARNPTAQTELMIAFTFEEPEPDLQGVTGIYHVTVQSGAMVQSTKMVSAEIATGGGLLAPYSSDNGGDGYFSDTETIHIVPEGMADLAAQGAWDRSMWAGYTALMLHVLR